MNPKGCCDICGSCYRTGDLVKCSKVHGRLTVLAGILIWTETSLLFVNSSFKNKSLLLGLEDSWEKPLDLDPYRPSQTLGAYNGPDIFAVYFYL